MVFDTLICLVLEIGVDYLDKVYTDLEEFVRPYVSNIEDRLWNEKLQHERYSIHPAERSLSTNVAALRLSVEIEVTEDEAYEDVEDRRTNIMKGSVESKDKCKTTDLSVSDDIIRLVTSGAPLRWSKRTEITKESV